ncbi:DEAD box ATP dependent RNA helicase [Fasciola hepatica]|uniref:DEAD box ATP dependent RNA helicase n=1 Tax=Fasciola hepatica TaxID=6192 RepID=A0A4E0RW10_FASHE|nr:DEAD box ATP dependent RNA helicase [Fasciola hepatica]
MESESVSSLTRSSEIDNLIIAAAAASGDEDLEGETTSEEKNVENADAQKIGLWRPVILQPDHIQSIRDAARAVCSSRSDKPFEPEPFSRKQGSEIAYQEMADLMSFHGESDNPERVELMRKHSMIFRPSGPNSRSLTLYEQAVNEAAAQIAFHFPAAIYHKRDLAILAKQAVRLTGFEFPNARGGYYPPGSIVPAKGDMEDLNYGESQSVTPTVQPAHAAPASASMLLHKSSSQSKRDAVAQTLSHEECNAIVQTVMDLSSEIPQFTLKSREHCSVNENYVYADAQRLSELPPSRLDDEMDLIRELSTVCGRVSGVPRPLGASLTPYEMGLNEAAAWLVRLQPALLTHSRQLAELARRIIAATGLQLRHTGGTSQSGGSHSYTQSYSSDKWSHRVSTNKHASGHGSDVVQIRLQGDSYTPDSINFGGDMFGSVVMQNGTPYYVDATGGTAATGLLGSIGGINAFEDEVASSGLDSSELVQLLGGSQAIAQLSDVQLEELGRAQFTVVDPRADSEMANCPLSLSVEEDDRPLDEAEILRVSRASCLKRVRVLSLPACGYTSINAVHLARCINLRLLDLSENALRVFPRRLHLPRLRRLSLTGNRFIHLPLIEQFPELTRLTVDEKIKQVSLWRRRHSCLPTTTMLITEYMLNPQMLAYFCPKLKIINGQCFDEMRTDFTMRIVQEARAIVEPHVSD